MALGAIDFLKSQLAKFLRQPLSRRMDSHKGSAGDLLSSSQTSEGNLKNNGRARILKVPALGF